MLTASYSSPLVLVSLFIATLASYTALNLSSRIALLHNRIFRTYWLIGGALSMGLGIWSMHFVGMLSFSLPIPLGYDLAITLLSLVIAILVSFFALKLMVKPYLSERRLGLSSLLMGLGIFAMHYVGMAAMRMTPAIQFDPSLVVLSLLIAALASNAALRIARRLRRVRERQLGWQLLASFIMGGAIAGMHYTGMAAASFPEGAICGAVSDLQPDSLAFIVLGASTSILLLTLVLSVFDARLQVRSTNLILSLKKANERLQHQATHDVLTGLPNRFLLFDRVRQIIATAERTGDRFAVYFMDLDGFKAVNDSLGHAAGDHLLTQVSALLREQVRKEDIVARLGGDEFVVVVNRIPDAGMAGHIAEKLFTAFDRQHAVAGMSLRVSTSIGIATYPDDGQTVDELISRADAAMYEVKSSGRNGYRFYEHSMNTATIRAIEIQRSLSEAMQENQLYLDYQPKFACVSGNIIGAEALLRWVHPALGVISPAEFVPIAERSGQILQLGFWVIERVCQQLRSWEAVEQVQIKVAINLSLIQLQSPQLVERIIEITRRHDVAPSLLMFEITETAAMKNAESTMHAVAALQEAGFDFAIDDFGTGYSSLSYLQRFGLQQLKIDRSFIANLADTAKGNTIVGAVIRLAHSLEMSVVAEGVETQTQLTMLRDLGCDQVQGYLLGRPMKPHALAACLVNDREASFGSANPDAISLPGRMRHLG